MQQNRHSAIPIKLHVYSRSFRSIEVIPIFFHMERSVMRKLIRSITVLLSILFLASVGFAEYELPFDATVAYIPVLEEAMDARYGSRDAWPQGFDTFLAIIKYYSGADATYTSTLSWASDTLRALETTAVSDRMDNAAVLDFLNALYDALEPEDLRGWSWSYEANALMYAAYVYSGNADSFKHAILPGENDLSQADAIAIALDTLQELYPDDDLSQYEIYGYFCTDQMWGASFWVLTIGLNDEGYELYRAYIASPSGEVLLAELNTGNG